MSLLLPSFVLHFLLLLCMVNATLGQGITSDVEAKEGDEEMVIRCNYSLVTTKYIAILWNEVNTLGPTKNVVSDVRIRNGRYKLGLSSGGADLIISEPIRNDSQRQFICEIQKPDGKYVASKPAVITVFYLENPLISGSSCNVNEGDLFVILCFEPGGNPVPTLNMYKDEQVLNNTINKNNTLVYQKDSADLNDTGDYMCKAESDSYRGENAKTSAHFELVVVRTKYHTHNETKPQSVYDSVMLTCINVYSNSPTDVNFTWLNVCDTDVCNSKDEIRMSVKNWNDSGNYQCTVETPVDDHQNTTCKVVTIVLIGSTAAAFFLGLVPTCILCQFIHKRREQRIRTEYQTSHYQALQFPSSFYKELTKVSSNDCARNMPSVVYEEVPN